MAAVHFNFALIQFSVAALDIIFIKGTSNSIGALLLASDMLMTLTCSLVEFLKILQVALLLGHHLDASSRDHFRIYAKVTDCGMRTKKMDSVKVNQMVSLAIPVNFQLSQSCTK